MSFTIVNALRWWVRDQPDRIALNVDDREDITFQGIWDWSQACAAQLAARGVKPGDRVGVIGSQAINYLAVAIGAQMIGAIALPLNIRFTERELRAALEDTTPAILFADPDRFDLAKTTTDKIAGLPLLPLSAADVWRKAPPSAPSDHHPMGEDVFAIMSTSGSTAKPKFVKFRHSALVSIALELQLIEPKVRKGNALILSPFFSGGLFTVCQYLVLGCTVFIRSKLDGDDLLGLVVREKISVFPTTPIFLERIAEGKGFAEADLSSIVWCTVGGARVPPALINLYRGKGVMLRVLFGQTEAGGAWAATGEALKDPMQAGYGGPFTEWRIMTDGQFLRPGEVGEIVMRGPSITTGYWGNVEDTDKALKDGWLHTGDLGKLDDLGGLTFVDRMKDIIISGGMNISAAEVEHVISEIDGVAEVAVIAATDAKFGETPLAVIYTTKPLAPEAVVAHCDGNLANYKVPRYVVVQYEPLPRLASGKISKTALRETYKNAAGTLTKLR